MNECANRHESEALELPPELRALELFGRHGLVMLGPTDCERLLGGSKGSWSQRLRRLATAGYLAETAPGDGRYVIGPACMELCCGYMGAIARHSAQVREMMLIQAQSVEQMIHRMTGIFRPQPEGSA